MKPCGFRPARGRGAEILRRPGLDPRRRRAAARPGAAASKVCSKVHGPRGADPKPHGFKTVFRCDTHEIRTEAISKHHPQICFSTILLLAFWHIGIGTYWHFGTDQSFPRTITTSGKNLLGCSPSVQLSLDRRTGDGPGKGHGQGRRGGVLGRVF